MIRSRLATLAAAAVLAAVAAGAARADVLDTIKQRGTLIVGTKADYKPFGFRDPSGQIIGIEPDLAADLAKRLGVKLELVPVVSANRLEFLQQGKIDIVLATLSDTPERRKVVTGVEPDYYSDFVNVMTAKKAGIKTWEDLKGKPVCATSGSWYNKEVARKYGPEIVAFDGSEKPLFALRQGNCVGYLYDQTFLQGRLLEDEWKASYEKPLPGILEAPWMIGVANGNPGLTQFLHDATLDWFKKGTVMETEKKWGIEPTEYSVRMHDKYKGAATN